MTYFAMANGNLALSPQARQAVRRVKANRTVQAHLPHTALQLVILPLRGLTRRRMGRLQAVQPMCGKESIRPAIMIGAAPTSPPMTSFSEDASQPHPNPFVHVWERRSIAVFEVTKPA